MMNLNNNNMNFIGKTLKNIRKENGLSVRELAQQLGIAEKTLWNVECGSGNITQKLSNKIAKLFNIDLNLFVASKIQYHSLELKKLTDEYPWEFLVQTAQLIVEKYYPPKLYTFKNLQKIKKCNNVDVEAHYFFVMTLREVLQFVTNRQLNQKNKDEKN